MRTLYLDCFCGISGDMTVGALLDLGADFAAIEAGLASLGVPGFSVSRARVNKHGIMATQFTVHLQDAAHGPDHGRAHDHGHDHHHHGHAHPHHHDHGHAHDHDHDHNHDHGHAHAHAHPHGHQPHRHLHHIVRIIRGGSLPDAVKQGAIAVFEALAHAEAEVHGTSIDRVHFHEVGAIDAICDIVAAQHALHLLGVERVVCSPIALGGGTVHCDHGVMPVPAPATALLLRGLPGYGGPVPFELTTPTGAALVRAGAAAFGPMPAMAIERAGYGCGTRDLADRPNVLRAVIGDAAAPNAAAGAIAVVEANVDDMTGELFPPLLEALLEAGARDVFLTPVLGKKGRPAHLVTALCDPGLEPRLCERFFAHSTTFGVRMREERRVTLERAFRSAATPWGSVRVKTGRLDGRDLQATPEYEDCAARAREAGVPVRAVYAAALAAAQRGDWSDA